MSEDQELLSQIERVKELNSELKRELQNNLSSNEVTLKSRNITEEIFVKLRTLLDKTIFSYLSKSNYNVDLSKLYFPISRTQNDFNSVIINYGLNNLSRDCPSFYNIILSFQPFSSKDK